MAKPADVETIRQWGIKSISSQVVEEISEAAHVAKLTNGQMIERLWQAWKDGGIVTSSPPPDSLVDNLVKLVAAAGPFTEANPMPGEVRQLINRYARMARGVQPGSQPGITGPVSLRITTEAPDELGC